MPHTLHLLDPSTSPDALEALLPLLQTQTASLAILGHRATDTLLSQAAANARTPLPARHFLPSLGWADPTGWRALKRLILQLKPTALHAWGIPAAVAAAMASSWLPSKSPQPQRIISLAELGAPPRKGALRIIEQGGLRPSKRAAPPIWSAATLWITRELSSWGIPNSRLHTLPLPVQPPRHYTPAEKAALRERLGLLSSDGPVLLLAGEGAGIAAHWARHDFGLWAGGILQTIFPNVRVLGREDPRGHTNDGWMRLMNHLADGRIPVLAPADASWPDLLAIADILVVPATGPVASAALLHAMAAELPIASMPIPHVQEFLEDNVTARLCRDLTPRSLAAPIEVILADPALRARLTAAAKARYLADFHPAQMLAAYQSLGAPTPEPIPA